ncbi:MAG: hypothetical protein ACK5OB_12170 [Pirellula sp.]
MTPIDPSDPIQRSLDAWGQHSARPLPGELKHSMQQRLGPRRAAPSYPALALSVGCIALACSLSLWWIVRGPATNTLPNAPSIASETQTTPPADPAVPVELAPTIETKPETWIAEAERLNERLNLELESLELEIRMAKLASSLAQSRDRLNHRIALDRVIASRQHNLSALDGWDAP